MVIRPGLHQPRGLAGLVGSRVPARDYPPVTATTTSLSSQLRPPPTQSPSVPGAYIKPAPMSQGARLSGIVVQHLAAWHNPTSSGSGACAARCLRASAAMVPAGTALAMGPDQLIEGCRPQRCDIT